MISRTTLSSRPQQSSSPAWSVSQFFLLLAVTSAQAGPALVRSFDQCRSMVISMWLRWPRASRRASPSANPSTSRECGRQRSAPVSLRLVRRYGQPEFVAQEEMDRFEGFWWCSDSNAIIYQARACVFASADSRAGAPTPFAWVGRLLSPRLLLCLTLPLSVSVLQCPNAGDEHGGCGAASHHGRGSPGEGPLLHALPARRQAQRRRPPRIAHARIEQVSEQCWRAGG